MLSASVMPRISYMYGHERMSSFLLKKRKILNPAGFSESTTHFWRFARLQISKPQRVPLVHICETTGEGGRHNTNINMAIYQSLFSTFFILLQWVLRKVLITQQKSASACTLYIAVCLVLSGKRTVIRMCPDLQLLPMEAVIPGPWHAQGLQVQAHPCRRGSMFPSWLLNHKIRSHHGWSARLDVCSWLVLHLGGVRYPQPSHERDL